MEGSMVLDNDKFVVEVQSGEESEDEAIAKAELKELISQELCDDLLEDSEEEASFYAPPPPPPHVTMQPPQVVTNAVDARADILSGTSQAYTSEDVLSRTSGNYDQLGKSQLEALYTSKCNQMKQMEEQINAFQEENEKKLGILRHMNRQLEADKLTLLEELERQRQLCDELSEKVKENEAMSQMINLLEREKAEMSLQVDSAQNTIQSLTLQLAELSQTDAIQRLRLSYEAALAEMKKQHEIEVSQLMSQRTATAPPETLVVERSVQTERNEESLIPSVSLVETASTSSEYCIQLEKEKRELIAQVEDLTPQLLSQQERAIQAEEMAQKMELMLESVKAENESACEDYHKQINSLQEQLDRHQAVAEAKLKTSLEQCRHACLKLHDDSSKRLMEELSSEKMKIERQHLVDLEKLRREIGTLKSSLATTQNQLVEANHEKEIAREESSHLKEQLEKTSRIHKKPENSESMSSLESKEGRPGDGILQNQIDSAIAAARKLWISEEDKRTNELIQLSLKQVQEKHSVTVKKLISEKGDVLKLLDETNNQKLKLEQDLKKTKDKLKKVVKRADKAEGTLKNFKEALPSVQKDLVELMASTLLAQEKYYTQRS